MVTYYKINAMIPKLLTPIDYFTIRNIQGNTQEDLNEQLGVLPTATHTDFSDLEVILQDKVNKTVSLKTDSAPNVILSQPAALP